MIPELVAHLWQSTLNESGPGALLRLARGIRKIPDSIFFAGRARDSRPPSRGRSGSLNRVDDRSPGIQPALYISCDCSACCPRCRRDRARLSSSGRLDFMGVRILGSYD